MAGAGGRLATGLAMLVLACAPPPALAAVRAATSQYGDTTALTVRVALDRDRAAVGEAVTLRIIAEASGRDAPRIIPPSLPPGLRDEGSSVSSSTDIRLPGGITRTRVLAIRIRASEAGEFRIAGAAAEAGGERVRADPVLLSVMGAASPGARGVDPFLDDLEDGPLAEGDPMLRSRLSADTVFVGEPVVYVAHALIPSGAGAVLRRPPQYIPPELEGFWVFDLPAGAPVRSRRIGASRYDVRTFRRAFVPLRPGEFDVLSSTLEFEVHRGLLAQPRARAVRSEPHRLVVRELPAGMPAGFEGAVGDFEVRAELRPGTLAVGEAAMLEVTVEGSGYVKDLPPPIVDAGDWIEVNPGGERLDPPGGAALGGAKTFTWLLVPRRTGDHAIAPVRYVFFDPAAELYRVEETAAHHLQVLPERRGTTVDGIADEGSRAPRLASPLPSDRLARAVSGPAFAWLQVVPLLVLLAAAAPWLFGVRARGSAGRPDGGSRTPSGAGSPAPDPDEGGPHPGRPRAAVAIWPGALVLLGLAFAGTWASLRTTPEGAGPARGGQATGPLTVGGAADLRLAESALALGSYDEAAATFAAYASAHPSDPAGWHGLATAHLAAADTGRAVWNLLQARRRAPRDARVSDALIQLGARPWLLARSAPPLPLSRAELLALAAVFWWALCGMLAVRIRGGRHPAWRTGAAASAAGLALLLSVPALEAMAGETASVLSSGTELRAEPTRAGGVLAELRAGEGVRIVDRRAGWIRAVVPDRSPRVEGWIGPDRAAPL